MKVNKKMKLSKLMTQPVIRIDEDSSIQEAVEIMGEKNLGTLLVMRGGKDIGVITAGDIISRVVAKKLDLDNVKVKEITSSPIVTVDEKTTGEEALRTMVEKDVGRLLITDDEDIVGIFTTSDITKLVP
jgi:CBS domain-containing protein